MVYAVAEIITYLGDLKFRLTLLYRECHSTVFASSVEDMYIV